MEVHSLKTFQQKLMPTLCLMFKHFVDTKKVLDICHLKKEPCLTDGVLIPEQLSDVSFNSCLHCSSLVNPGFMGILSASAAGFLSDFKEAVGVVMPRNMSRNIHTTMFRGQGKDTIKHGSFS